MTLTIDDVRTGHWLRPETSGITFDPQASLSDWLCAQATTTSWLLAHSTEGVIWGRVTPQELHTSHDVAPNISPALRPTALHTLRLFNPDYEVRLWRAGDEWQAMRINDMEDESAAAIDEYHLLWGTHAEPRNAGFIRLEDGAQGLRHVVPPFAGSGDFVGPLGLRRVTREDQHLPRRRAHLHVRHYLTEDDIGVNRVTLSRLVAIGVSHYEQK